MKLLFFLLFAASSKSDDSLVLISKVRTSSLSKYEEYIDGVIIHLEIPRDVGFASIKFIGDEAKIYGCKARDVDLYMKYNTLPVINPDGSKFPTHFKNITREGATHMKLRSDKNAKYFNMTTPQPGCYYISAFLPYTDPRYESIQPPGLRPECLTFVDALLFIQRNKIDQILDGMSYSINSSSLFKIQAPEFSRDIVLEIDNANVNNAIGVMLQSGRVPTYTSYTDFVRVANSSGKILKFPVHDLDWYYLQLNTSSNVTFTIDFLYYQPTFTNITIVKPPNIELHSSPCITNLIPYKQYDLIRESSSETFSYSYELPDKFTLSPSITLNVTSDEFTILKFRLRKHSDIGGLLQFGLGYDAKLTEGKRKYPIVACLRPNVAEIPTWPNYCHDDKANVRKQSPLVLNDTVTNMTIGIPYPEYGLWYATFKVFCGECQNCNCSKDCQSLYDGCKSSCTKAVAGNNCTGNCSTVDDCTGSCKAEVIALEDCKGCDCHGDCLRSTTKCNASVIFDVGAEACANRCGKNGRCSFMVADGVVYATCVCSNKYRGWDCSDDALATPYHMVVIELLLLVLSNLAFLPTVYFAYRRRYYVEAVVYFSICFFSTFYHACDAGENIISYCITRLGALQFADFFCALLSIWVTLVAIADLSSFWPMMCHITGAIILAFTTTINKTAFWGFLIPVCTGIVIIGVSWYLKWRKLRRRFLQKRYLYVWLPLGVVVVVVGIVIFTFLETADNYKYLHSSWHVIMAIAVILLLPRKDTFQPETML